MLTMIIIGVSIFDVVDVTTSKIKTLSYHKVKIIYHLWERSVFHKEKHHLFFNTITFLATLTAEMKHSTLVICHFINSSKFIARSKGSDSELLFCPLTLSSLVSQILNQLLL